MPKRERMLGRGQHMAIERRKAYEQWLLARGKRADKARQLAERDAFLEDCPPLPSASARSTEEL